MNGENEILMMSQRNWRGRYFWLRLLKQRYYSAVGICDRKIYHRSQRKHIDYIKQTQIQHVFRCVYSPVDSNRIFP